MSNSINSLALIINLNERLFLNTLEGFTEDLAKERISDHNNPVIWIATHTAWARFNMSMLLGKPITNPYAGMFENFRPYSESDQFPSLEKLKADWHNASEHVKGAIQNVTPEQLETDAQRGNPIGDSTNGGTLAFLVQHESYSIGQLAFLKKFYTKEAMKY
ncbi:DinB family protein [Danxiaibacter flavus]|uniref:DinB family protein n=1 Tax=Danxiaibacter flavus TaxID=3049108 RepID=A0ABV3ZH27_9BACT|nr:DinB family protein [Chitinophagaceae bacterium DXS]